ncbi:leukosialin isoform X2 [Pelodiscus sinensis]|uniref:leukosialin isoform X2 n=1 Tax=Pelodiscus sinensis TaxID=13735 RepID=UPI003F6CC5CC
MPPPAPRGPWAQVPQPLLCHPPSCHSSWLFSQLPRATSLPAQPTSFTISSRPLHVSRSHVPAPSCKAGGCRVPAQGSPPDVGPHLQLRAGPGSPATRLAGARAAQLRGRARSVLRARLPSGGAGRPDAMACPGARPPPKRLLMLLVLLAAAASATGAPLLEAKPEFKISPELPPEPASNSTRIPPEPASNSTGIPPEPASNSTGIPPEPASNSTGIPPDPASNGTGIPPDPASTSPGIPPKPAFTGPGLPTDPASTDPGLPTNPAITDMARDPTKLAQLVPTTQLTPAMENSSGSASPSDLASQEATLGPVVAALPQEHGSLTTPAQQKGPTDPAGQQTESPGPWKENQTEPGKGPPSPAVKAGGTHRPGETKAEPTPTHRPGETKMRPTPTHRPGETKMRPTPTHRPGETPRPFEPTKDRPTPSPSTPPGTKEGSGFKGSKSSQAAPPASLAPSTQSPNIVIIVVIVIAALVGLCLLATVLHCRRRRRSGSTSFNGGRAGPGEWAGPAPLAEEQAGEQPGDGVKEAGPGESRRPTLTTFFGKRHSRVSSVAMEDVPGAKAEGALSEPLLPTGNHTGDPAPQGGGEANGTVPSSPGPPSPPPEPPANGDFPPPPPMEQEVLPPV